MKHEAGSGERLSKRAPAHDLREGRRSPMSRGLEEFQRSATANQVETR
jgi:hypothetical protein